MDRNVTRWTSVAGLGAALGLLLAVVAPADGQLPATGSESGANES